MEGCSTFVQLNSTPPSPHYPSRGNHFLTQCDGFVLVEFHMSVILKAVLAFCLASFSPQNVAVIFQVVALFHRSTILYCMNV